MEAQSCHENKFNLPPNHKVLADKGVIAGLTTTETLRKVQSLPI